MIGTITRMRVDTTFPIQDTAAASPLAAAALQQLHARPTSVQEAAHGAADGGTSGVVTRLTLEHRVEIDMFAVSLWRFQQDAATFPSGVCRVAVQDLMFLNLACPLFAKLFTCLSGLGRVVDGEDDRDNGWARDLDGNTADVVLMKQQLFNMLPQKTDGNPFHTGKHGGERGL